MPGDNYYLLTSLESLGELGAPPPMSGRELLARVDGNDRARRLVEALLLGDDLLQREAFIAGELEKPEPAVLTETQVRNEEPLPDFLQRPAGPAAPRVPTDVLWSAYYRHVAEVADRQNSPFLKDWVGFEVTLRNAVVAARASALGLEAADYTVTADLGDPRAMVGSIVTEWSAASDPLSGLRALDRGRWAWLDANDRSYSFSDDEIVAYAARLMLVQRWYRLTQAESENPTS